MGYIVYLSTTYASKKADDVGAVIYLADNFQITGAVQARFSDLAGIVMRGSNRPVNFSIDRTGAIVQDRGSFSRMVNEYGVVLAEFVTQVGDIVGCRLLTVNGDISSPIVVDVPLADILNMEKRLGRPYLQNAIIRNNTINSYPRQSFPRFAVSQEKKQKRGVVKPVKPVNKNVNPDAKRHKKQAKMPQSPQYTKAQEQERAKCREHGVDVNLISDPKLSPEQMRVLWVSKSKGCLSEYFAHPDYSVDVMKFYGDRLYSENAVQACGELLHHRDLDVDTLSELYLCIDAGLDYTPLIGMSKSAIEVERLKFIEAKLPIVKSGSMDIGDEVLFGKVLGAVARTQYE